MQRLQEWYDGLDPHTYVGIIENSAFNAVACRHQLGEFVGLYVGAITQLTAFAYQLLSDPTCYPDIGDVSLEEPDPQVMKRLTVGDLEGVLLLRFAPTCPARRRAADRIAECACLTLCLHEIAHIQGCHLDLIYEDICLSEYQEISIAPLTEMESLLLKALELEADSVALVNSLSIWRVLSQNNGYNELATLGATRSWLIATELLFWVMSLNHDRARPRQLSSHPSPLTRYINMRMIKGVNGCEDAELIHAIGDPKNMIVHWIAKHTKSSPMFDTSSDSRDTTVSELTELHEYIRTLWSRLEPYQHARTQRLATLSPET